MRVFLRLVAVVSMVGACTSILDFDGYVYVDPPASGGGGNASASASSTNGSGGAGGASASSSAGGTGGCTSHLQCLQEQYCDPNGNCHPDKQFGTVCEDDEECLDSNCEDVCCQSECEGTCEACDLQGSEGMCSFVPTGQDPNDDCPTSECDGAGNCL